MNSLRVPHFITRLFLERKLWRQELLQLWSPAHRLVTTERMAVPESLPLPALLSDSRRESQCV